MWLLQLFDRNRIRMLAWHRYQLQHKFPKNDTSEIPKIFYSFNFFSFAKLLIERVFLNIFGGGYLVAYSRQTLVFLFGGRKLARTRISLLTDSKTAKQPFLLKTTCVFVYW